MVLRDSIEITKNVPAIGLYSSECKIEFIAVKINKNNLYYHEIINLALDC